MPIAILAALVVMAWATMVGGFVAVVIGFTRRAKLRAKSNLLEKNQTEAAWLACSVGMAFFSLLYFAFSSAESMGTHSVALSIANPQETYLDESFPQSESVEEESRSGTVTTVITESSEFVHGPVEMSGNFLKLAGQRVQSLVFWLHFVVPLIVTLIPVLFWHSGIRPIVEGGLAIVLAAQIYLSANGYGLVAVPSAVCMCAAAFAGLQTTAKGSSGSVRKPSKGWV